MIVTNCPARDDIVNYEIDEYGNFRATGIDTPNYCVKHKTRCEDVNNCIIKAVINGKGAFDYAK